jgi:hypothetical protein
MAEDSSKEEADDIVLIKERMVRTILMVEVVGEMKSC